MQTRQFGKSKTNHLSLIYAIFTRIIVEYILPSVQIQCVCWKCYTCREDMDASISRACGQLVKSLTTTDKVVKVATNDPNHYDVFVSYCHADTKMATPIVDRLKKLNPELKIFYDVQELKTGEPFINVTTYMRIRLCYFYLQWFGHHVVWILLATMNTLCLSLF